MMAARVITCAVLVSFLASCTGSGRKKKQEGRIASMLENEKAWVRTHAAELQIARQVKVTGKDAEESDGDTTVLLQTLNVLQDLDLDRVLLRGGYDKVDSSLQAYPDPVNGFIRRQRLERYTLRPGQKSLITLVQLLWITDEKGIFQPASIRVKQADENKLYSARSEYILWLGDGTPKQYKAYIYQKPAGSEVFEFAQKLGIRKSGN